MITNSQSQRKSKRKQLRDQYLKLNPPKEEIKTECDCPVTPVSSVISNSECPPQKTCEVCPVCPVNTPISCDMEIQNAIDKYKLSIQNNSNTSFINQTGTVIIPNNAQNVNTFNQNGNAIKSTTQINRNTQVSGTFGSNNTQQFNNNNAIVYQNNNSNNMAK